MKQCDLTLQTPEENLACDEALLEFCEEHDNCEVLRLWQPAQYFIVVGYADRAGTEVNLEFCRQYTLPVLRRCSGGGAVLQGPGCLNYSLVLRIDSTAVLRSISGTNSFILRRHQDTLAALLQAPVEMKGHTDLAIGGLKFSGNAQRRRRNCLLFHGCFLLHLDLALLEKVLPLPSRQPDYRLGRSHRDFLINLSIAPLLLKQALIRSWAADEPLPDVPLDRISSLAREKYSRDEWNFKF
jgi:lipoate---protein ligase